MAFNTGAAGMGLTLQPLVPKANIAAAAPFALAGVTASNVNEISLTGGQTFVFGDGRWLVKTGPYTLIQFLDPVTNQWRTVTGSNEIQRVIFADGSNVRLANLTGCPVGAFMTNCGSAYSVTSPPTVTSSSGNSKWTAVTGSAMSTTVTITTAGVGYNNPPTLIVSAPPAGGIPATAVATVSGGAITAVTVINQGGGYSTAPTILVVPDPRDTPTTSAVLTAALTTAGSVAGLILTDHGQSLTTVPTLTFSSGAAAATVVMCFSATSFTVSNAGAVYGNAQPFLVQCAGGVVAGTAGAIVNPQLDRAIFIPRTGLITGTSTAGGAVTATGAVIQDAGLYQAVPTGFVLPSGTAALPTTTAIVTINVGATNDTSYIQAI